MSFRSGRHAESRLALRHDAMKIMRRNLNGYQKAFCLQNRLVRDSCSFRNGLLRSFFLLSAVSLLCMIFASMPANAADQRHILIVHSYHKGLRWTDTVDAGMLSVISERGSAFETHTEYLDTKRSGDETHYLQMRDMFRHKYRATRFSAVLVSDDDAYNFMLRFRDELFPMVPVIFCGVNYFTDFTDPRMHDIYTGVVEAFDIPQTIRVALKLHPETTRIVIINDRSTTGKANRKIIDTVIPEFSLKVAFDYLEDLTMDELRTKLRQLKPGTVILLMTFNLDRSGEVFNYDESIGLIAEAAPVPIYGVWDFYLGNGIVGGMLTSGRDQGRMAAEMAMKIIDGTPVRSIPVVRESPNRFMFDYRQLERFRIPPDRIPPGALIINRPPSFYREHKEKVWAVGAAFMVLSGLVAALLVNIRRRKKSEESLRISEEKFSKVFRSSPDWISISRLSDGRYLDVNEAYLKTTGFTREEVIGKTPFELGIYGDSQDPKRLFYLLRERGSMQLEEMVFRMKSGEPRVVQRSAETIEVGGELLAISIVRDITEEKKAKEAVLASEQRYRAIFENASEAILIIAAEGEQEGTIVSANPAAAAMHGYSTEEMIGLHMQEISPPGVPEHARMRVERILQGEWISEEVLHQRKDGTLFPIDVSAGVFVLDGHRYILVFGRDISLRKETEAALHESERRLSEMLEKMRLVAVIHDLSGKVTFCNQFFLATTGLQLSEVIGNDWFECFVPDDERQQQRARFRDMIAQGRIEPHSESRIRTKSGDTRFIAWNTTLLRDPDGTISGVAAIGEDITERRRLEDQLRHAQKMEAVGQLAGGIAHDFNNILTATIGYCHLLLAQLPEGERTRYYAEQILSSSEKAASLTQSLLAFSRKQMLNPQPIDLNSVLAHIRDFAARLLPEDIEFQTDLADQPLVIMADAGQIEQVVLNMVTNARDAMPFGGYLSIRTEIKYMDENHARFHGYGKPGIYALLTVSDTGEGIPEDLQKHVFEPFFTTKATGKGTGLGLSMVYGIIKQHDGYIDFYSAPDEGTTFRIYFPLVSADAIPLPAPEISQPIAGGSETILVIEDNSLVRNITCQILREHGYTIVEAVDGEDGIAAYQQHREVVDLVICDVIMPKKSGKEVHDAIVAMNPEVKILFTSGYTADIIGKKGILGRGLQFIRKPLVPADLLRKVREVLDLPGEAHAG